MYVYRGKRIGHCDDGVLDRREHGDSHDVSRRLGGISFADFSDGDIICKPQVTRIEAELSRCLIAGAWAVAKRVIERARKNVPLNASKATLERFADGRRLAYGDAGMVARRCGVMLHRGSVTLAATVLERVRTTHVHAADVVTANSHVGTLEIPPRSGNAIEGIGIVLVGELVSLLDSWYANPASRPRGIGNSQQAEISHELERHGLLGPVASENLSAARAKRLCLTKARDTG
jgi:hypothetical protein